MPSPIRYAAGVLAALSLIVSLAACGGGGSGGSRSSGPLLPIPSSAAPTGPSPYQKLWSSTGLPDPIALDAAQIDVADAGTVVTDAKTLESVDTATGKLRWRIDLSKPLPDHPDVDLFADTITVAGDVVVTSAMTGGRLGVVALSLKDGTVRWSSFIEVDPDGNELSFVAGASGGVVVWALSGLDGDVTETIAVRASDGKGLWRRSGVGAVAVSGDTVVGHAGVESVDHPGRPLALDLRTGKQRWQAPTAGEVQAVSDDWVFASDSHDLDHTVAVAYALSDGHSVDAGEGQVGWAPTVHQVRPMGDGIVWCTTGTSIDYHVLADGSSSPTTVDVGLQASVVPYTLVGKRLLAGAYGTNVALATYDLEGHKTAPDLPGKLIGVYGDHLVLAEGPGTGTYFSVYRISG